MAATIDVHPTSAPGRANVSVVRHDRLRCLQRRLLECVSAGDTKAATLRAIATAVSEHVQPLAIVYFDRDDADQLHPCFEFVRQSGDAPAQRFADQLRDFGKLACQHSDVHVAELSEPAKCLAIAAPVDAHGQPPEVVVAIFPRASGEPSQLIAVLQLAAAHLVLWHTRRQLHEIESEARDSAALLELVGKIEASNSLRRACYALVNEAQEFLGCRRVALGLQRRENAPCRLQAISGMAQFDKRSTVARALEAAFDETIVRGDLTVWPPSEDADRHAALAHQKLCAAEEAESIISSPLRDEQGRVIGAWLFVDDKSLAEQSRTVGVIRAAEKPIANCLSVMQRAERGPLGRLARWLMKHVRTWRGAIVAAVICLLLASLALPLSYKVKCDCQIEPVTRRFVSAPFEGRLEKTLVKPGDVVAAGDVLARMDGRELRWERAGLVADRNQAAKKRDSAMAQHNFAAAQVAKLEMERLDLQIRLLDHHAEQLDIKSPIDGVVTSGDLERAEGAPLTQGQTLFEIAPLDEMIVEVAVPQDDVRHVQDGQPVIVRLDAYPGKTWRVELNKVQPRSEIRDHKNVFVGEVTLANDDGRLRPGMKGQAKIVSSRKLLGWILFHKPWNYAVRWLGW